MTILEQLINDIEEHEDRDWQFVLKKYEHLDDKELSEIAIDDIDQLTRSYQFEEHFKSIKLDLWDKFYATFNFNVMWSIFQSVGCYINYLLYLNNPLIWCSWVDKFCDYVKVAFIQCLLDRPAIHVNYDQLLDFALKHNSSSLPRFLIYAYICKNLFLNEDQFLSFTKHRECIISIVIPVLSDFHFSVKFKNKSDQREVLINALGVNNIILTIRDNVIKELAEPNENNTNNLKGKFWIWAKCLEMVSSLKPDQEFSELYCQWIEYTLKNHLFYEINRYEWELELNNIILISHYCDNSLIERFKSIFARSFSPYGGWNNPNKAWKRDYLFQHTGLLLCAFGIRDSANDELINFILVHVYKIIPFVLNMSEYELLLVCLINYPWNEEHKSLNTLIKIVNTIDSLELIDNLETQYLKSGGKSSLLLDALSTQKDLLMKFNHG